MGLTCSNIRISKKNSNKKSCNSKNSIYVAFRVSQLPNHKVNDRKEKLHKNIVAILIYI